MNHFTKLSLAFLLLLRLVPGQAQDGSTLIPGKAIMVADFNLKKLTGKVNYQTLDNFYWFGKIDAEIQKETREKYEQVSLLYKNPTQAGIDTTAHIYFFLSKDSTKMRPGFIVPVKDKQKFDKTFLALNSRKGPEDIKTYKGSRYITTYSTLYLWNNRHFIIMEMPHGYSHYDYDSDIIIDTAAAPSTEETVPEEEDEQVREQEYNRKLEGFIDMFLTLPLSQSIASNADFKSFKSKDFDMGLWMNLANLADTALLNKTYPRDVFGSFSELLTRSLKSSYVHSYANFNRGEIVVSADNIMNPELVKQTEKIYSNRLNPQLLRFVKKDSLAGIFTMSMNLHEMYNYLNQGGNTKITHNVSGELASVLFSQEIAKDTRIKELNRKIDSLNKVAYPYYYGSYEEDTSADTAVYAPEAEPYTEEPSEEAPKEKKNKKQKKEKAGKGKKKNRKKQEEEYNEDYSDEYTEEPEYTAPEYNYEEMEKAQNALTAATRERDSLEKIIALKYMKEKGLNEEDFWHLLKGDMVGAVTRLYYRDIKYISYDYDEEMNPVQTEKTRKQFTPEYVFAATVDRKDKLEILLGLLEEKGLLSREGNVYKLVFNKNMPDNYFYITGNIFVITNRQHLALNQPGGYTASLAQDPAFLKIVTGTPSYMSADIGRIMKIWRESVDRRENKEMIKSVENTISKVIVTGSYPSGNRAESQMKIIMQDGSQSSVISIFKLIEGIFLAEAVY